MLNKLALVFGISIVPVAELRAAVPFAIPLPWTGAWTGALVAAMLNLRLKNSEPTIFMGVAAAGLVMVALTTGALAIA